MDGLTLVLAFIATLRDWVMIIAIIITWIMTLVAIALFGGLWFFTRKYLGKLNKSVFPKKVRPALERVHTQLVAVRDRTSRLPGNTPLPEGEATPAPPRRSGGLNLPFRKKKRRIPLLG